MRTMFRAGVTAAAVIAVAALVVGFVIPAAKPRDDKAMTVVVETQDVGPGVQTGTEVLLRGVPVGQVTALRANSDGTSSITMSLQRDRVRGMGRDFTAEFRPKNYFGITGIAITDPGSETSGALGDGDRIVKPTIIDATMSTMIEVGSDMVNGTLVPDTMSAISRVLRYTSAFEPLIHTGIVVADVVARTQRNTPAYLIDRYNEIVNALPPFASGVLGAFDNFYDSEFRAPGDVVQNRFTATMKAIANYFFALVGRLLKSNEANLTPLVNTVTQLAGILPGMDLGAINAVSVRRLVDGASGAFQKGPDGAQTLRLKIVVDRLPAMAGPVVALPRKGGPR